MEVAMTSRWYFLTLKTVKPPITWEIGGIYVQRHSVIWTALEVFFLSFLSSWSGGIGARNPPRAANLEEVLAIGRTRQKATDSLPWAVQAPGALRVLRQRDFQTCLSFVTLHCTSLTQPPPGAIMGPGIYSSDRDCTTMEMPPLCVCWPNSQGSLPGLESNLCSVSFVQNARMPLPWRGWLCCQLWEKQPELLFTPWIASWVKIALAAWSSFKPHCRKRLFLEEKIFLPTHRSENGHLPGGEEETIPRKGEKYPPFSTCLPKTAHQETDEKRLPLTARSGLSTGLQVT